MAKRFHCECGESYGVPDDWQGEFLCVRCGLPVRPPAPGLTRHAALTAVCFGVVATVLTGWLVFARPEPTVPPGLDVSDYGSADPGPPAPVAERQPAAADPAEPSALADPSAAPVRRLRPVMRDMRTVRMRRDAVTGTPELTLDPFPRDTKRRAKSVDP